MKNLLKFCALFFVLALFCAPANAASITSAQSGNWNNVSTWVGGAVPGSSDDAIIAAGHTVTLDVSPTVANCTVNGTGTLDAGINTLTVTGTFTLTSGATFKQGGAVTTVPGATRAFDSNSTYIFNGAQNGISDFVSFGNLTWSSSIGASLGGNLSVAGNLTLLNCNELQGSFGATAPTHSIAGNVVVDGSSAALDGAGGTGSGTWNINGNVTIQNGGSLKGGSDVNANSGNGIFNIKGNLVNNGTIAQGNNATGVFFLNFTGMSAQSVSGTEAQFDLQNITINNSAGVTLNEDIFVQDTLFLTSGAFSNQTFLHFYAGGGATISRSGGTLGSLVDPLNISGDLRVTYTGSSPTTTGNEIPATSDKLADLTINNSGGVTLNSNATVNGTLILTNGKLTLGSKNLTVTTTNAISVANASTYIITNSTGALRQNVPTSNTDVSFPVGTSLGANPAVLNNNGGQADTFSVKVVSSTSNVTDANSVVHDQWTVSEGVSGGSNLTLRLQWNAGDEGSTFSGSRGSAHVGLYSGSGTAWTSIATSISGSGPYTAASTAAVTSAVQNAVFTVALPVVLPVELTSFTATPSNGKIELAWTTATETNNSGFDIERRTVSSEQAAVNNWTKIGFVDGHGTTNAPQNYSFTDASATIGKYAYRLKQIDRNGAFVYNQEVDVTSGITPNTILLDNNYPNPFNPSTKISFVLGTTGHATLKVFNLLGQEVATLANGNFNANEVQEVTFDASHLSSGIYYYQLKSGDRTEIKKMMLLK
ncbi:MAG TPA: T9SS type A sorting domain-containing protein [Bacteroidota bacterium]|nr:T9SS type A sorting domain-containing protein [Bacteroidota bacterium]